jgi:glucan phosphoethanolaminetransferase (alkaline phosphatase superfamily)
MRAVRTDRERAVAPSRLLALGLLVALSGCGGAPPRPDSVILIAVDTLRADHMSLYGYDRATSPVLDALARDGIVFEQARSQAACTCPSINSMLTSRYAADFLGQG